MYVGISIDLRTGRVNGGKLTARRQCEDDGNHRDLKWIHIKPD